MMSDILYHKLDGIRNEYRAKMVAATDRAQGAAASNRMDEVSMHSTEAERAREAFTALNRVIAIMEAEFEQA